MKQRIMEDAYRLVRRVLKASLYGAGVAIPAWQLGAPWEAGLYTFLAPAVSYLAISYGVKSENALLR